MNDMRDIAPILRSLGLLESEVLVYLAALELGPATVLDLARATHLSRPATYTSVDSLGKRGLMSAVTEGRKRLFAAEHPDRLLAYAKRQEAAFAEQVADLQRTLPELALRVGGAKPVVKSFEGKEGVRAIIDDLRETRPTAIDEFTNMSAMLAVLSPGDLAPARAELEKIGTKVRGLYVGATAVAPYTDARVLPDAYAKFAGDVEIYGEKVALITFSGKFHSVIIEDATIAQTMRTLFNLAWQAAASFPVVPH